MRTLLTWLFGFVTARMVGSEPEALLNQCAQQGLTLWKMERLDPVTLLVKVPAIQWRRVEALAERMGCQAEDIQRRGVPCFLGRFRRRYGLLVGLVLLVPALEPLFAVAPLSAGMVGAIVGLAFGSMVVIQLLKLLRR